MCNVETITYIAFCVGWALFLTVPPMLLAWWLNRGQSYS